MLRTRREEPVAHAGFGRGVIRFTRRAGTLLKAGARLRPLTPSDPGSSPVHRLPPFPPQIRLTDSPRRMDRLHQPGKPTQRPLRRRHTSRPRDDARNASSDIVRVTPPNSDEAPAGLVRVAPGVAEHARSRPTTPDLVRTTPDTPPAPEIHVSIGRIEVRAVMAPAQPTPRPRTSAIGPALSLEAYLQTAARGLTVSNHLAIATVTAGLRQTLGPAVGSAVAGATVTTLLPDAPAQSQPEPRVNLFLYQVTPNSAWRNADLPARNSSGTLVQRDERCARSSLSVQFLWGRGSTRTATSARSGGAHAAFPAAAVASHHTEHDSQPDVCFPGAIRPGQCQRVGTVRTHRARARGVVQALVGFPANPLSALDCLSRHRGLHRTR